MKSEIKKFILNIYFICSCTLGIIIVILHLHSTFLNYNSMIQNIEIAIKEGYNPHIPITNAFTLWIGWDYGSKYSKLFFALMPLISVVPHCYSYYHDEKSIKDYNVIKKSDLNYHISKYFAVFISSGLTIAIPLLLNFMIILMFIPALSPDSVYDIYYGIFSNNFMSDIFYTKPLLYISIFLLLNFIYCGLFGCIGYTISTFINSKIVSVCTPIFFIILIECIKNNISINSVIKNNNFSPMTFLCPANSINTNWIIIIVQIIICFVLTFYGSVVRFKKSNN